MVNDYEDWWNHHENAESLMDKIENNIYNFIRDNWNSSMEFYVEFKDYGQIEITVFNHELLLDEFIQFIIHPICNEYNLIVYGLESYKDQLNDNYSYYEWTLGRELKDVVLNV